ncbi:MAG: purine-nucleoside phosphorylase [Acidothermales bacterium]|nr:purine-nucleoside phosphorylase [Acidothermales bacterium]
MSTHIGAAPGEIADTVLMPGDPLRARWIAETYLDDARCYSEVRNMFGYTGSFRGTRVSVQGSGMGMPSLAIYAHEMLAEYGVRTLVRVGSCGALTESLALRDVVVAMSAATDSSMNTLRFRGVSYAPTADFGLLRAAVDAAARRDLPVHVGQIASWDSFYADDPTLLTQLAAYGVLAVEMETAALYTLAARFEARALSICTVSDHLVSGEQTTALDRERTFAQMTELALDTVVGAVDTG